MTPISKLFAASTTLAVFTMSLNGASAESITTPKVTTPKVTVQPKVVKTPNSTLNPQPLPPVHDPNPGPSDRTMK